VITIGDDLRSVIEDDPKTGTTILDLRCKGNLAGIPGFIKDTIPFFEGAHHRPTIRSWNRRVEIESLPSPASTTHNPSTPVAIGNPLMR